VASRRVSSADRASVEAITSELIGAGFRPIDNDEHRWIGPIDPAFHVLTNAATMVVEIRDGFPWRHPYLFVDNLLGRPHVNEHGNVCMWEEDDDSGAWRSLAQISERVRAWIADQLAGPVEPALDTHLYFPLAPGQLVILDLGTLDGGRLNHAPDGASGRVKARFARNVFELGANGSIDVRWYRRTSLSAPPVSPAAFRSSLTSSQAHDYESFANRLGPNRLGIVLLIWDDAADTQAILALRVDGRSQRRWTIRAVEVARTDTSVIGLRSGPDAALLGSRRIGILGVGAIGSQVAVLLARCGIGGLELIDPALLRPGDVTRHAAAQSEVGMSKTVATLIEIARRGMKVAVNPEQTLAWADGVVAALLDRVDLVVDATANAAYTSMLSSQVQLHQPPRPLIAVALHRGGAAARVRAQVDHSLPIGIRGPATGFPLIPALPLPTEGRWETGCGAPVNNAPPWAIAAATALTVQTVTDILAGRLTSDRDLVDVYEPFGGAFVRRGLTELPSRGAPAA
jgi:hypothetical protein